ncbi:unnamed protein product [Parajaminaea phylloscopi]
MSLFNVAGRRGTASSLEPLRSLFSALSGPSSSVDAASSSASSSSTFTSRTPSWSRSASSQPAVHSRKSPVQNFTKAQKKAGQLRKRINLEKRALRQQLLDETRPDPVLGYRPGNTREAGVNDEALWESCELRKIILRKEEVWGITEDRRGALIPVESPAAKGTPEELQAVQSQGGGPLRLNFGLDGSDRELLFKDLPDVMAKDRILDTLADAGGSSAAFYRPAQDDPESHQIEHDFEAIQKQEGQSSGVLQRILDLRNASGKGIDVENKRRIVEKFGDGKNTGSVETQVALLTYRLHLLHEHLSNPSFRKDDVTRRSMTLLVHKRARLLKYLKKESVERYTELLARVGVHPRAVEGEIIVGGRPKLLAT